MHSWQRGPNLPSLQTPYSPILPTLPPFSNFVHSSLPLVNDIMYLCMSVLGTLVPEGLWCVFYARCQVYWGLTLYLVYACTLIWYQMYRQTQHTQGPVDIQTHIKIYLNHLLCAHSSCLYCIEWIIHYFQKLLSFYQLFACKGHMSLD